MDFHPDDLVSFDGPLTRLTGPAIGTEMMITEVGPFDGPYGRYDYRAVWDGGVVAVNKNKISLIHRWPECDLGG